MKPTPLAGQRAYRAGFCAAQCGRRHAPGSTRCDECRYVDLSETGEEEERET